VLATQTSITQAPAPMAEQSEIAIDCDFSKIYYGDFLAVRDSRVSVPKGTITGFIGPSGCGKSTVLRSLNRMNDMIPGFRLEGHVHFLGQDVYAASVDPVVVRRYIGMVFQQPNPFSMSILRQCCVRSAPQPLQEEPQRKGRARFAPRRIVG
jgi:phosphate transport system ATP-binding protein